MNEILKIFSDAIAEKLGKNSYLPSIISGGGRGLDEGVADAAEIGVLAVYDHGVDRGYNSGLNSGKVEGRAEMAAHKAETLQAEFKRGYEAGSEQVRGEVEDTRSTFKAEFDRGFAQGERGYQTGVAEGRKESFAHGHTAGYEEGRKQGRAEVFSVPNHPLMKPFREAVTQASSGKGEERHGRGADFMAQPWVSLAKTHGRGFLTGQAAKKLDEAQHFTDRAAWRKEMLGALVYIGMSLIEDDLRNITSVKVGSDVAENRFEIPVDNPRNEAWDSSAAAEFAVQSKALAKSMDEVNAKPEVGPTDEFLKFLWTTLPASHQFVTRDKHGTWHSWESRPALKIGGIWDSTINNPRKYACASPHKHKAYAPLIFDRDQECGK